MTMHPQTRIRTCVWIECAGCGTDSFDDGIPHFADEAEALAQLLGDPAVESDEGWGWTQRRDGRLLCRACSDHADCEDHGHEMTDWRRHPGDPVIEWRHCEHCGGAIEDRLVALGRPS